MAFKAGPKDSYEGSLLEEIAEPLNDGKKQKYYQILDTEFHLEDIIKDKGMAHPIGEAFCAIYRLKTKDTELRNIDKAITNLQAYKRLYLGVEND